MYLSWDWCALHPTSPYCVHSRKIEIPLRPVAAKLPTRSALVVSHHLDGLLRSSVLEILHPSTGQGPLRFTRMMPFDDLTPKCPVAKSHPTRSPQRSHPSKKSPHQQPYHVTVAVALMHFTIPPTQIVRQHHDETTSDPASCRFDPLPAPSQSINQTPPPKRSRYTRPESKEVH